MTWCRPCLALVAFLNFVPIAAPSSAQSRFLARLEASQVLGGTSSTATGSGKMTLNVTEDALTYSIILVGLDLDGLQTPGNINDDVTAMHFHAAPPGTNGGIVFGLIIPNHDTDDLVIDPVAGTLDGIWENTDLASPLSNQLANLRAGGLYLNVHTTAFPGGAIRGQVEAAVFADGFESGGFTAWSSSVP